MQSCSTIAIPGVDTLQSSRWHYFQVTRGSPSLCISIEIIDDTIVEYEELLLFILESGTELIYNESVYDGLIYTGMVIRDDDSKCPIVIICTCV